MLNYLSPWTKDGQVELGLDDDIVKGSLITRGGEVVWEPLKKA